MKDRACGIIIRDNKLMFIEQRYEADRLVHMLVGGGVEKNETPVQAVIRELKEEANVGGKIIFGPVVITKKRRMEYIFVISIGNEEPSPGYDPEYTMDDQDITDIIWLDADTDIDKFTDIDIEYFTLVLTEAEKLDSDLDWMKVLNKIVVGYGRETRKET